MAKMNLTRVDYFEFFDNFKLSTQLSLSCLSEFANIRQLFFDKQSKNPYVLNFVTNLCDLVTSNTQNI